MDRYFKFIHPLFPVITASVDGESRHYTPAVRAVIYIVALDFANLDEVLCIQTAYDRSPRKELADFVWSHIQARSNHPTLDMLQSALLLALSPAEDMLMPENEERLRLGSLIVSMANTLGLQHDPSSWDLPPWEIALRRRLSALVRANDSWIAAATGRPGFITSSNWLVDVVSAAEVRQDTAGEENLDDFVRFSELSNILRIVLEDV